MAREVFQQFAATGPDQRDLDAALASYVTDRGRFELLTAAS